MTSLLSLMKCASASIATCYSFRRELNLIYANCAQFQSMAVKTDTVYSAQHANPNALYFQKLIFRVKANPSRKIRDALPLSVRSSNPSKQLWRNRMIFSQKIKRHSRVRNIRKRLIFDAYFVSRSFRRFQKVTRSIAKDISFVATVPKIFHRPKILNPRRRYAHVTKAYNDQ